MYQEVFEWVCVKTRRQLVPKPSSKFQPCVRSTVPVCLYVSALPCFCFRLCLSVSVSLSVSVCVCVRLSMSMCLCVTVCVYVCFCVSVCTRHLGLINTPPPPRHPRHSSRSAYPRSPLAHTDNARWQLSLDVRCSALARWWVYVTRSSHPSHLCAACEVKVHKSLHPQ